jgi:hypothetical protein
MIPTKSEFYKEEIPNHEIRVEYAKVVALSENREPLLQFIGETMASPKIYPRMTHYNNPRVGDRVMLINDIIIGTWSTRPMPPPSPVITGTVLITTEDYMLVTSEGYVLVTDER